MSEQLVNRVSGEVLDLKTADVEQLAEFCDDLQKLRDEMSDAEGLVKAEILSRMDKQAEWTIHAGPWKLEAPSPTAGTIEYPIDLLCDELRLLVERGTITEEAARRALQRRLVVEWDVPLDARLNELEFAAQNHLDIDLNGVKLKVSKATSISSASKRGITALHKVEGTGAALARVAIKAEPIRRVKVSRA